MRIEPPTEKAYISLEQYGIRKTQVVSIKLGTSRSKSSMVTSYH